MQAIVVIPTYNEAGTVEEVLKRVRASSAEVEVLIVDDDSPDGTADIAARVGADIGGVDVLCRRTERGFASAYKAGFIRCLDGGADVILQMDADLSHDPSQIPELIAGLEDYDMVIGSRYVPGGAIPKWTIARRLLSSAGNRYASTMLGLNLHDVTSGYRAFRADILKPIDFDAIRADGYAFQIELARIVTEHGARVGEIPIRFVDREIGESKMSVRIIAEAMVLVTGWGLARMWRHSGIHLPRR